MTNKDETNVNITYLTQEQWTQCFTFLSQNPFISNIDFSRPSSIDYIKCVKEQNNMNKIKQFLTTFLCNLNNYKTIISNPQSQIFKSKFDLLNRNT